MTYEALLKEAYVKADRHHKEREAVKLLLMELSHQTPSSFFMNQKTEVDDEMVSRFRTALDRYVHQHIPVQHLIGHAWFFGYPLTVNEHVLIPRGETEQLVEHVLHMIDTWFDQDHVDVLDLGTGSGCIGLTIALEAPHAIVTMSDISTKALEVATMNRDKLGAKATLIQSDLFSAIQGTYDIIVSNPPYIPRNEPIDEIVGKEPYMALYGGEQGIEFYEHILEHANHYLKPKGLIAFEHGDRQKEAIYTIACRYLDNIAVIQKKDLAGKDRFTFIGTGGILK